MFNIFNKRFGGETTVDNSYVNRLRLIVSGSVIFSLAACGLLVYVFMMSTRSEANQGIPANLSASSPVDVLIAKQRIEEGSTLRDEMFDVSTVSYGLVRPGTVLAKERLPILGMYTKYVINAGQPINQDDVTNIKPNTPFRIPPGDRAVTIIIDARTGVEGFARPNSRVDVIWCYTDERGSKQVRTIVPFAKVLSVGGATQTEEAPAVQANSTTATLLVKNRDAKIIELARNMGTLSLTLVGSEEPVRAEGDSETISLKDVLGSTADTSLKIKNPPLDGEMWTQDPSSGRMEKFVLRSNRWERDNEKNLE